MTLLEALKAQQRRERAKGKKTKAKKATKKRRKKAAKKAGTRRKKTSTPKRSKSRGERMRALLKGYYRRGELGKASRLRAKMKKAGMSTKT